MPRGRGPQHKGARRQFTDEDTLAREVQELNVREGGGGRSKKKEESDESDSSEDEAEDAGAAGGSGDEDGEKTKLSRREREELQRQRDREAYERLHAQHKTAEAQADLARLAIVRAQREEAAKKREAERQAKEVEAQRRREEVERGTASRPAAVGRGGRSRAKKEREKEKKQQAAAALPSSEQLVMPTSTMQFTHPSMPPPQPLPSGPANLSQPMQPPPLMQQQPMFAHSDSELLSPSQHPLYKTAFCFDYKNRGHCQRGDHCFHAHQQEAPQQPKQLSNSTRIPITMSAAPRPPVTALMFFSRAYTSKSMLNPDFKAVAMSLVADLMLDSSTLLNRLKPKMQLQQLMQGLDMINVRVEEFDLKKRTDSGQSEFDEEQLSSTHSSPLPPVRWANLAQFSWAPALKAQPCRSKPDNCTVAFHAKNSGSVTRSPGTSGRLAHEAHLEAAAMIVQQVASSLDGRAVLVAAKVVRLPGHPQAVIGRQDPGAGRSQLPAIACGAALGAPVIDASPARDQLAVEGGAVLVGLGPGEPEIGSDVQAETGDELKWRLACLRDAAHEQVVIKQS
uniref:C3H1-type domain-containing protein n=1 Tax=Macrostomum lignano TaxID=282301 RepID=A0A1I8I188_9PLAT